MAMAIEEYIHKEQVKDCIKQLKNNNSGEDNITEMLKHDGEVY